MREHTFNSQISTCG